MRLEMRNAPLAKKVTARSPLIELNENKSLCRFPIAHAKWFILPGE